MNFKDYFQKQAEAQADKLITESDRQFCKALLESNEEVSSQPVAPVAVIAKKPWYKQWDIIASIACAVCILVIIVSSVLINNNKDDFLFKDENIVSDVATVEQLQSDLKYVSLPNNLNEISYSYDSVTKTRLFYNIKQKTEIADVELVVVINENYNYSFEFDKEEITETLDSYSVIYNKKESINLSGTTYNYKGYIKVQTETVYFEYKAQEAIPEEYADEAFFDDIQQLIGVK
ncbi:MAG: hypothetical protein HDQ88_07585 [Clostridia bacterium]|nr:hypothetical protein [Clostridia bacterium]